MHRFPYLCFTWLARRVADIAIWHGAAEVREQIDTQLETLRNLLSLASRCSVKKATGPCQKPILNTARFRCVNLKQNSNCVEFLAICTICLA